MNLQEEILKIKNELLDEFDKRVEALKVDEQEFPRDGDEYWYMGVTGNILTSTWEGFPSEKDMLKIGNIFKTKEQAEFAVEKLKVEAELRKFSRPFEEDEYNSFISLYMPDKTVAVDACMYWQKQGVIYFESDKKAQQAIESVGQERIKKYIFGVEAE